jgi:hypothetical protein
MQKWHVSLSAYHVKRPAFFRFESATKEAGLDLSIGEETRSSLTARSQPDQPFSERVVHLKGYEQPHPVWGGTFEDHQKYVQDLAN